MGVRFKSHQIIEKSKGKFSTQAGLLTGMLKVVEGHFDPLQG